MEYTIADRLMWHFMQGRCFKVLREECAEWDISQLRKEAKKRYREIVNATPSIGSYRDNSLKKNLTGGMVWIAIYETAKERYGEKMSIALYEKMCRYSIANPMMLKMARLSKPFTRKFQEGIMKRSSVRTASTRHIIGRRITSRERLMRSSPCIILVVGCANWHVSAGILISYQLCA
jgi:type I restriction enzyme S subunit